MTYQEFRTAVEKLRILEEMATSAPWRADTSRLDDVVIWSGPHGEAAELITNLGSPVTVVGVAFDADASNARFIEAARNLTKLLLDRLDHAEALLREVQPVLSYVRPYTQGGWTGDQERGACTAAPKIDQAITEFFK